MTQYSLDELMELARKAPSPSLYDRERQRRSFAYGNATIENKKVTRETIKAAAEALATEESDP